MAKHRYVSPYETGLTVWTLRARAVWWPIITGKLRRRGVYWSERSKMKHEGQWVPPQTAEMTIGYDRSTHVDWSTVHIELHDDA